MKIKRFQLKEGAGFSWNNACYLHVLMLYYHSASASVIVKIE